MSPLHTKGPLQLSKFAFWDVDLSKMDYDKFPDFTIIRVFERGTLDEIIEVINYYGEECVIRSLTTTTTLLPRARKLGEILLGLSRDQFACDDNSQYSKF